MENRKIVQSRDKNEMNIKEKWGPKKTKSNTKKSFYLQPNPSFNLMSNTRKPKIGLLKNGHLSKSAKRIEGQSIYFSNTCAFDALAHASAGAYFFVLQCGD